MFEGISMNKVPESARLTERFKKRVSQEIPDDGVFEELEADLESVGFSLADAQEVVAIFSDQRLLCRSESFEKVMGLIMRERKIDIVNLENEANMCVVLSGQGFRVAMTEGFSGKEVGGAVKAVITFQGIHLTTKNQLGKDSRLWEEKPQTAKVSLSGSGTIDPFDVRMVSFRFPVRMFPREMLSEEELGFLDEEKISFIVRHYIRKEE